MRSAVAEGSKTVGPIQFLDRVDARAAEWARRRRGLVALAIALTCLGFGLWGAVFSSNGAANGFMAFIIPLLVAQPLLLYLLAVRAENDMERRGVEGRPVRLMVFFVPIVGIAYWLTQRRQP